MITSKLFGDLEKSTEAGLPVKRFSKPPPSATRPQLHSGNPYRIWGSRSNLDIAKRPILAQTAGAADTKRDTSAALGVDIGSGAVHAVRLAEGIPPRAHSYIAAAAVGLVIVVGLVLAAPALRPAPPAPKAPVTPDAPKDQSRAPHTVGATVIYYDQGEP